jgi:putative transposase
VEGISGVQFGPRGAVTCFWLNELSILTIGMSQPIANYKNHRFSPEIIARAVWLYYRFPLSLRHVEEMLLERGIAVSYETIRPMGQKTWPGLCSAHSPKTTFQQ